MARLTIANREERRLEGAVLEVQAFRNELLNGPQQPAKGPTNARDFTPELSPFSSFFLTLTQAANTFEPLAAS
jgi:hypothetical protein